MSTSGHAACLTPKNRFLPAQRTGQRIGRYVREGNGLQLALRITLGTTTGSVNAFDAVPEQNSFVCCAGPSAILSQVDEHLNITQRLFRANPQASPLNSTHSFYNPAAPPSTPGRNHRGSPLKDRGHGVTFTPNLKFTPDSPSHTGAANNRAREATCVSLSHEGKLLAVGETGYNPRVLLFSTAPSAAPDIPLSVLTDHSFGISSIAFSHDSRWLCSLGNIYDGFVLIYSINPKKGSARLYSSNKCSNVNMIAWMGDDTLITLGLRHVKVWRPEQVKAASPSKTRLESESVLGGPLGSPTPRTLWGRNCLLGPLIDATFTSAVAISNCKAILCTSNGDLCLLDDSDRMQRLEKVSQVDFSILCVTFDRDRDLIWVAGEAGNTRSITTESLVTAVRSNVSPIPSSTPRSPLGSNQREISNIIAIGSVQGRIITLDSGRIFKIRTVENFNGADSLASNSKDLPAHESPVLGVCSLLPKNRQDDPDFLSFSAKGTVLFWLLNGTCTGRIEIPLHHVACNEEGDFNELKSVVASDSDNHLVHGDKLGALGISDRSGHRSSAIQAHNGEINSIAISKWESFCLVASCGRDRTLQLFRRDGYELNLMQTLDDHAGAVVDIMFLDGAASLMSISSDRTIIVRKLAFDGGHSLAFIPIRVITLKASPVSFAAVPLEPNAVVVTTMDKQIQKYEISTGRLYHTFKASDPTSNETVIMSLLQIHRVRKRGDEVLLLIGVSSPDRAIRVHDYDNGSMLSREHGQIAVSAIKILQQDSAYESPINLISCGFDGTVMIWDLSLPSHQFNTTQQTQDLPDSPIKQNPAFTQPLRKVLSKAEVSSFHTTIENGVDTITPIRSSSPSRIRQKTSRYSLAIPPKINASPLARKSNASAIASSTHALSQNHPLSPGSHENNKTFQLKQLSLDHRHRSKSAANLNDLNDSVEQICRSLRTFRKRIDSAAAGKLMPSTAQELERELDLTTHTLNENIRKDRGGKEAMAGDLLDTYLSKMNDENITLKTESDRMTKTEKSERIEGGG